MTAAFGQLNTNKLCTPNQQSYHTKLHIGLGVAGLIFHLLKLDVITDTKTIQCYYIVVKIHYRYNLSDEGKT